MDLVTVLIILFMGVYLPLWILVAIHCLKKINKDKD